MAHPNYRRGINTTLAGPEWDPLFAYAQSQGITPPQAVRELLAVALKSYVSDPAFVAAVAGARTQVNKIVYVAAGRALRAMHEEIVKSAIEAGVPPEAL